MKKIINWFKRLLGISTPERSIVPWDDRSYKPQYRVNGEWKFPHELPVEFSFLDIDEFTEEELTEDGVSHHLSSFGGADVIVKLNNFVFPECQSVHWQMDLRDEADEHECIRGKIVVALFDRGHVLNDLMRTGYPIDLKVEMINEYGGYRTYRFNEIDLKLYASGADVEDVYHTESYEFVCGDFKRKFGVKAIRYVKVDE